MNSRHFPIIRSSLHTKRVGSAHVHLLPVQVVDGSNGAKARGDSWPAFHRSTVHTSPLTYDIDFDNVQDILVSTYDGEILFFKDTVGHSLTPWVLKHKHCENT